MGKHILILLILSLIALIWIKEIAHLLNALVHVYIYLSKALSRIVMGGYVIAIIRQSVILMMIPVLITLIPAGVYWLAKRRMMPYLYEMVYAAWLIMLTVIALYKF